MFILDELCVRTWVQNREWERKRGSKGWLPSNKVCVCVYVCACVCMWGILLHHLLSSTCNIQCYPCVHMNEMLPVNLKARDSNTGSTPVDLCFRKANPPLCSSSVLLFLFCLSLRCLLTLCSKPFPSSLSVHFSSRRLSSLVLVDYSASSPALLLQSIS